jgi:GNAT superfamily N-acetyltransferase
LTAAEVHRIECLTLRAWPALEDVEYDGWRLRAAQGYTGRANSVAPLAAGQLDLAAKIAHCEQWYTARGLPAKFRVTPFSQPGDLDATLAQRGYAHVEDVMVMTAEQLSLDVGGCSRPAPSGRRGTHGDGAPWLHQSDVKTDDTASGGPVELTLAEWMAGKSSPVQQAIIERIEPTHWLLGWRHGDELVARALGVVEDGWLGIFNVSVVPAHQRRGVGRALMLALAERARRRGARQAYLQVVADNAAAVGLYTGLGFREAYRYWYRTR